MKAEIEFKDEWLHFLDCINFGSSFLDARAIGFMNEFNIKLNELLKNSAEQLKYIKHLEETLLEERKHKHF